MQCNDIISKKISITDDSEKAWAVTGCPNINSSMTIAFKLILIAPKPPVPRIPTIQLKPEICLLLGHIFKVIVLNTFCAQCENPIILEI